MKSLVAGLTGFAVLFGVVAPIEAQYTEHSLMEQEYLNRTVELLDTLNVDSFASTIRSDYEVQNSVIQVGYAACSAYATGLTPDQVVNQQIGDSDEELFQLVTTTVAAMKLCPEYNYLLVTE